MLCFKRFNNRPAAFSITEITFWLELEFDYCSLIIALHKRNIHGGETVGVQLWLVANI